MMNKFIFTSTLLLGLLTLTAPGWAADADLDPAFSGDGYLHTDFGVGDSEATAKMAVQPDGKIVVSGTLTDNTSYFQGVVVRYTPSGMLDAGFGVGGKVELPITDGSLDVLLISDIALLSNGKILLTGALTNLSQITVKMVLIRLNADGSLDTGFDGNGYIFHSLPGNSPVPQNIMVQADGKYIITGRATGTARRVLAARFNSDGSFDTSFSQDGFLITEVAPLSDHYTFAATLQADGKILLAGQYDEGSDINSFIIRITSDGELDTAFANNGLLVQDFAPVSSDGIDEILVAPDGSIIVSGRADNAFVARFSPAGLADPGFATSGVQILSEVVGSRNAGGLVLLPDGKIMVSGYYEVGDPDNTVLPFIARLNTDGTLDTAFNSTGYRLYNTITTTGGYAAFSSAHLMADGGIALAGHYDEGSDGDFLVARLINTEYDILPAAFSFTAENEVETESVIVSGIIEVSEINADVPVAVSVSGGEYKVNTSAWTSQPAYVFAGDQIAVRHTSATDNSAETSTTLTVGGFFSATNPNVVLGERESATFTSTTKPAESGGSGGTPPPSSPTSSGGGGGGSIGWLMLLAISLFSLKRRNR